MEKGNDEASILADYRHEVNHVMDRVLFDDPTLRSVQVMKRPARLIEIYTRIKIKATVRSMVSPKDFETLYRHANTLANWIDVLEARAELSRMRKRAKRAK